jgi:hypothetical protein
MRILVTIFFSFILINGAFSQKRDSVLIDSDFLFPDGIYLDFNSVKKLTPINLSSIITNLPINDIEIFKKLVANEKIGFYDNEGIRQQITTKNIWGYSNKRTLYKNSGQGFFRIPVVASISQFVAEIMVVRETMNDPYMGSYTYGGIGATSSYESKEAHTFIISFETGVVYDYNYKNFEELLSKDEELFLEFSKLKKRDKKHQIFLYIRKYNQKYPLYLGK